MIKRARASAIRCGDPGALFELRDTGIGIPRDASAGAVHGPSRRWTPPPTRKYGGTGLGLSIVNRLVELMGGETGVKSEAGRGLDLLVHRALRHARMNPWTMPRRRAAADHGSTRPGRGRQCHQSASTDRPARCCADADM